MARKGLQSNEPCRATKGRCAMETSAPPQCQDCDRPLSLVTAVDGFFDRPPVRTFKCEKCSRLVVFSLEDGRLRLMDPALLAEFCDEYTRHMNKLRMESNASLGAARGELARLAKQRENIIEAIKDGVPATRSKTILPAW